jgi:protein-S-isoprenylcysteine O-methyltransferase Ste14
MSGRLRVGAAWVLVVPFLVLSRPTSASLVTGACLAVTGLAVRAWAAGWIDKGAALATGGPYAHTRNPLYLGSFIIGVGIALAGAHWAWLAGLTLLFVVVYVPTMRREAAELNDRFGERYRHYAASVPAFSVRLSPYRRVGASSTARPSGGFTWSRYRRYREWEAALGVLLIFGALVSRLVLLR